MTPRAATDAFFRGAFEAWLLDRRLGEEVHAVEEVEAVYLQVSTTDGAYEARVLLKELERSRRPRQRGAKALAECLEEARNPRAESEGGDA